jgi:hypothetical protein
MAEFEKYAVVVDFEHQKTAGTNSQKECPQCSSTRVNWAGVVPHCPNCGTKPWETPKSRR